MRPLIFIVPLFSACTADYEMVNHQPLAKPAPGMILSPSRLVFPEVVEGEAIYRPVSVTNNGNADLWLDNAQILGEGSFWLASMPQEAIEPGTTVDIEIGFVPTGIPEAESILQVFPEDPQLDDARIELLGTWGTPDLQIWPRNMDFGSQTMGCPDERTVWLVNGGTRELMVSELMLEGAGFELEDIPTLPLILEPEESVSMVVSFAPAMRGVVETALTVISDDPIGPAIASLAGAGVADGQCVIIEEGRETTHELQVDASYAFADIAFVLDTSGSMGDTLDALRTDISQIADQISDSIDDVTFGLATYEDYAYGGMGAAEDRPFSLRQSQSTDIGPLQIALSTTEIHNGLDKTESTIEAIYQAASGVGYDQNCNGEFDAETDVMPMAPFGRDAFEGAEDGILAEDSERRGGMAFRESVLPIIVFATDDITRDPSRGDLTPGGCSRDASRASMHRAVNRVGAGLVGIAVEAEPGDEVFADLATVVGGHGVLVPWAPDDGGFQEVVVGAIEEMIAMQVLDEVHLEVVEDAYGMVDNITPDQFLGVAAGEEVAFAVSYHEAMPEGETFAWVTFDLVTGTTRLQRYTVEIRLD